jgi:dipeptidyl aminopeptidase/acylaminoacyl peptidase
MTKLLGCGSWRSPISSELIVAQTIGLSQLKVMKDRTYWIESRPSERGRNVVVQHNQIGELKDVNPAPFNSRSRVHEYGGGSYVVSENALFLTRFDDQMLYRSLIDGTAPSKVTDIPNIRFADGIFDSHRQAIFSICEEHGQIGKEAINFIARVDLKFENATVTRVIEGYDFFAFPTLSPDGNTLAWIAWNHPHMPWDGAELWIGSIDINGNITEKRRIAGGNGESVYQPKWSSRGILYFVADPGDWWNIYRWTGSSVEPVLEMQAEFGRPLWTLGSATFGLASDDSIICSYNQNGFWKLGRIRPNKNELDTIPLPYTAIFDLQVSENRAVLIAGAPSLPTSVVEVNLSSGACIVLKASSTVSVDPKYISEPESIEYPTTYNRTAFALYYPPKNGDFTISPGELPPLIVKVHGGPTDATTTALNLRTQFWTSRGFAVVDVNYGGSTGYGKAYRNRLKENWGVVDVDDSIYAAMFLSKTGKVDGTRMAISGGSAGGFTALCALTFHNCFQAGTSLYGISDLKALLRDTHKFESRYPFWLIGPYPEMESRYQERSPLYFAEKITSPVIFLQGEEDQVVPPNQTELMANALLSNGKLFGLLMFSGEQHGFRKAESIKRALDAELDFFSVTLTKSGLRF